MFVRKQQTDDFFEVRDQQDEESAQSTKVSDNTIKGAIITQTLEKEVRRFTNQLNTSSQVWQVYEVESVWVEIDFAEV